MRFYSYLYISTEVSTEQIKQLTIKAINEKLNDIGNYDIKGRLQKYLRELEDTVDNGIISDIIKQTSTETRLDIKYDKILNSWIMGYKENVIYNSCIANPDKSKNLYFYDYQSLLTFVSENKESEMNNTKWFSENTLLELEIFFTCYPKSLLMLC